MNSFNNVDPKWAWQPFQGEPRKSADQNLMTPRLEGWNARTAAHLYRRAGFGGTAKQVNSAIASTPSQVVKELVQKNIEPDAFRSTADRLAKATLAGGDSKQLSAAWAYRLLYTPNQLLEKMTLFWHGHFATGAEKVQDAEMMWRQNELLRNSALGQFEPLVQAIARDPAMLVYLDSTSNRKAHPNENFARELMELFCLGEGHYSEYDVQQLARCFTGWEIKNERFRKNRYQQDREDKKVLGTTGPFDGEEAIKIVLEQPEMARFICRKLFHFFVCDEPRVPDRIVEPLADIMRRNDLRIAPVVETILGSNLFFSEVSLGRKIKSPVELAIGVLRNLEGTTNTLLLSKGIHGIGQGLFYPPNVKGWDGGRSWINSSTLLGRTNLVHQILSDKTTRFAGGNLQEYFQGLNIHSAREITSWLCENLIAVEIPEQTVDALTESVSSRTNPQEDELRTLVHSLATLPEFQLC